MVIYKTLNKINGKQYIGMDSKNNPSYLGSGTLILKAIKKYGKENFKKEILEVCSNISELENRETYWINYYNALEDDNFYNLEDIRKRGTNPFKNKTQDELKIIFDKINTLERAIKIGLSNKKPKPKGFGNINPNPSKGSNKPKGFKGRISPSKKEIICWGKGEIVILNSLKEGETLGFDPQQISRVINNKLKTHKKYKFITKLKLIKLCQKYIKINLETVQDVGVMLHT